MTEILILLFLLSTTTIFARGQILEIFSPSLAVPALILSGYLISPQVSGIFLPSTITSISPALRVGLVWISFLVGLRYVSATKGAISFAPMVRGGTISILHLVVLIAASYGLVAWFRNITGLLTFYPSNLEVLAISLVVGGIFSGSNISIARYMTSHLTETSQKELLFSLSGLADMLSLVAIGGGLYLWSTNEGFSFGSNLLQAILLGLVLALAVRLLIESSKQKLVPARLALLGLVTLGAGGALGTDANEALVGFSFGMFLALLYRRDDFLDSNLKSTEWPVQMGAYFFLGLFLQIQIATVVLGLSLALLRLLLKYFTIRYLDRSEGPKIPIASVSSFSAFALVMVLAIDLSNSTDPNLNFFASTFAIAAATTDFFTVIFWATRSQDEDDSESEVADVGA